MSENTAFEVAVVGDNTIDRYLGQAEFDLVGGNALNVAVQLSMMGIRVRYFGAVGSDDDAEVVREAMQARNLDLAGVSTITGRTALTRIRIRDDGDRFFETEDFGVTAEYYPENEALAAIASAQWVHIGMLPRATELRQALAAQSSATVSQDCSVSSGLSNLTLAFASAGEDPTAAHEFIQDALDAGCSTAVATLGAKGATAGTRADRYEQPAVPTIVVDTTGAGDSFMAGYIAHALSDDSIAGALRAGAERGSFTCRYTGGWPQLNGDRELFG